METIILGSKLIQELCYTQAATEVVIIHVCSVWGVWTLPLSRHQHCPIAVFSSILKQIKKWSLRIKVTVYNYDNFLGLSSERFIFTTLIAIYIISYAFTLSLIWAKPKGSLKVYSSPSKQTSKGQYWYSLEIIQNIPASLDLSINLIQLFPEVSSLIHL